MIGTVDAGFRMTFWGIYKRNLEDHEENDKTDSLFNALPRIKEAIFKTG